MEELTAEKIQVSELLVAWNNGEETALTQLLPIVEIELRRIAHNYMRRERGNHTLQTSALVNEAFVKLIDQKNYLRVLLTGFLNLFVATERLWKS